MARKRNYKAEYERRVAKGRAAGKTRQQSRGHQQAEHVERKRRTIIKYGMAPEPLRQLRKRVVEHVISELNSTGTKGYINQRTITRGIRYLHRDSLLAILDMDGSTYKMFGSFDYGSILDTWDDADNEDERNPFWYH